MIAIFIGGSVEPFWAMYAVHLNNKVNIFPFFIYFQSHYCLQEFDIFISFCMSISPDQISALFVVLHFL